MRSIFYQVSYRHSHAELLAMDEDERMMSEGASCTVASFQRCDEAISFALTRHGRDRVVEIADRATEKLVDVINLDLVEF